MTQVPPVEDLRKPFNAARFWLLVLAAVAGVIVCLTPGAATAQSYVTVTVTNSPGFRIPDNYTGLSFEIGTQRPGHGGVSGYIFSDTNTPVVTLCQNMGLHNLRIGGGTVDGTNAVLLNNNDIDNLFAFARAVGSLDVIYSLQLENGNTATDAATAQYIAQNDGAQLNSFAIGNEPDFNSYHYPPFGTGTDPAITDYPSYLADWRTFAATVTNAVPGAVFAGPDTGDYTGSTYYNGESWTQHFADDEQGPTNVILITQHYYVGGSPGSTTAQQAINNMLSTNWVLSNYPTLCNNNLVPVIDDGLPYRLTESNDYLTGITNASNAFASALWALDYMHWWAAHGCAGVNFHNKPWLMTDTIYYDSSGLYQVNPKAYAIKSFDLAGHGNVEPLGINSTNGLNLTAYAVSDQTNLYVTLINKEQVSGARDAVVTIALTGFSSGGVEAMFLLAPSVSATNGVTLGGASITNNAPWAGQWTALGSITNQECTITVTAGSAALVKIGATAGAPVITRDLPAALTLVSGKSYSYSVGVDGAAPFHYQWYNGTTLVSGQTNASFALTAGSPGIASYQVVVTNSYGAVTSAVSTLTIVGRLMDYYAYKILSYGPAGYWPLQETNAPAPGNMETNYGTLGKTGNAWYAATASSVVAFGQPGALAGDGDFSVGFSGSGANPNSYAFVPRIDPALTIHAPFTLEAWVKPSSTSFGLVLGEGGGTGFNGGANFGGWQMGLGLTGGNNRFQMQYYTGIGSAANNGVESAITFGTGIWYHYVVTYDGANSAMYIDGTNIFSATTANAPDTWSPLAIGAGKWDFGQVGGIRWLQASEDEVALYTNVLAAARITAHYNAGVSAASNYLQTILTDSPLLYYRMDHLSYTNPGPALCPVAVNFGAAPVDGFYPPGTLPAGISGPAIPALGTNSVASPINGVFSCIDAGNDPSFNPTGTESFTAMTWFRTYPADGRVQTIMSHGGNASWSLNLVGTNGLAVWNSGAGSVTSTTILNDGNWHFVAGVYDGTNNYLYVDGTLNNSAAATGSVAGNSNDDVYLGGDPDFPLAGNNQRYLAGAIAQAAFFTNAMSAAQVQSIYQAAVNPPPRDTVAFRNAGSGQWQLNWNYGVLQSAANVVGPYSDIAGAAPAYTITFTNRQQFYRLREN